MLERISLQKPDDYFLDLGKRSRRGVYVCRICEYNAGVHTFIRKYYEAARLSGVIVEGKLKNPDQRQLEYYQEIMGPAFEVDKSFFSQRLKKWLPRMNERQRENVAGAMYVTLIHLREGGKNDNMLKNAYIKFMCWLYYRFERIVNHLGEEKLPKILYEGEISIYELLLMRVLTQAGCDLVLLEYHGDEAYRKVDPSSEMSEKLCAAMFETPGVSGGSGSLDLKFPDSFHLGQIREELEQKQNRERLYGTEAETLMPATNVWLDAGNPLFEEIKKPAGERGSDPRFFYNCFCRICGVEDKLTYENELYQLGQSVRGSGRKLLIVNHQISPPTVEEIEAIRRKNNYQTLSQLVEDLSKNLCCADNRELQQVMRRAFAEVIEEGRKTDGSTPSPLNRMMNVAVYLICWLKRYQRELFQGWKKPELACFFHLGGCQNEKEAMFCRFLARLPVDVVIFKPDLNEACCLSDSLLYEVNHPCSLAIRAYPEEHSGVSVGTAAYHAERELDSLMYQDSGLYREQQYAKANAVVLKTMYEEIPILWDQELKYRPGFSTFSDTVNMPVIFSKISGVKNGEMDGYWQSIKALITADTENVTVISRVPNLTAISENPIKPFAVEFFRNGRLQKEKIRQHRAYPYGFLREPMQEYLLDKIQLLIDRKTIRGTGENGTEFTIVSTALNLEKPLLRMIQKFDFTKKNPKLIYIIAGEEMMSLEDAIQMAFLNLVGFDILLFVPTGYQCAEQFFREQIFEEHQIGEYRYEQQVPDFNRISLHTQRPGWCEKLFRRRI
ncbi:YceG family protein [Brotaphodocola sp.]|uniref:YceG family protein n=1 Tax=Brotaphodocola sp. TaxID=3073577 RepID=UPI003D7D48AD